MAAAAGSLMKNVQDRLNLCSPNYVIINYGWEPGINY